MKFLKQVDVLISKAQALHIHALYNHRVAIALCSDTVLSNINHKHTLTTLTGLAFLAGP